MAQKLEDRVIIVTGAASGIGLATALTLADHGAKVVVSDIMEAKGNEVAQQIQKKGTDALFVKCNVSDASEVKNMIEKAVEHFGKLDGACNNAGIEGNSASTADLEEPQWNKIIDINLKGVWLCMKYEIPHLLKQKQGSIVNMASVAGLVGFAGIAGYVASKHGIVGLTKTAALDYARQGIRVNAICPGVIRTAMIDRFTHNNKEAEQDLLSMEPVGRLGTPEEIANAVVWLLSDESSFVTGQAIAVDGGLTSR